MGFIFDARAARFYEAWYHSPQGRAMERLVRESAPTLLEILPGERILDIGCGEGNHLLLFRDLGFDVSGLDASPYMVRRARERLGQQATLKVGEAEDLPFDDNEFDLAFFINTMEFLDDPVKALQEAGRVARRAVFIGTFNLFSWYCLSAKTRSFFRRSLFSRAAPYHLWQLKSFVHSALGDVPIQWRSGQVKPPVVQKIGGFISERWSLEKDPFAAFLALSATLQYRVRTVQTPLKMRLEQAGGPVVRGATMGEARNERSHPL